jgi:hypothetical protein
MQHGTDEALPLTSTAEIGDCITSKVIALLQSQRSSLAGDDSGLGTVWLEYCAQVQGEQSVDWDGFELLVHEAIEGLLGALSTADRRTLWLQTSEGKDWLSEVNSDQGVPPVDVADLIEAVYGTVWRKAADWEDPRVERYLAQGDDDLEGDGAEDVEDCADDDATTA